MNQITSALSLTPNIDDNVNRLGRGVLDYGKHINPKYQTYWVKCTRCNESLSLTLIHYQMFDKNRKNPQADLSAGVEGGLLLSSGVVLPPLVLCLHLQGVLGLLSSVLNSNEILKRPLNSVIFSNLWSLLCSSTGSLWVCQDRISLPRHSQLEWFWVC